MSEGLSVNPHHVEVSRDPLAPPTRVQRVLYAVVWYFLMGFAKAMFRVRVEGRDNLPADRPFILAPVHRSNLDFLLVLGCATATRRMRYLAKDTLWKGGFGLLWDALGAFPVHRGAPDREALKTCIGVLERGEPLVMFPEGTRQSGPVVQPLFDGPAYVQAKANVPIVPVGIGGSEAAMPKGAKLIRPQRVVVVVGEPLAPPAAAESGRTPRHAIREQTERLHIEVQELFDRAQELAGTPNPRSPA